MVAPATRSARRHAGKDADERADERRERLLDAGLALFGTQGFASSSIEAICSQARLHFFEVLAIVADSDSHRPIDEVLAELVRLYLLALGA
jgi:hypothetical protein